MSDLREALGQVRRHRGDLTPGNVVDEWRPADHPEHGRLEWDNTVAGEAYRRDQAHRLIQSVRVRFIENDRPKDVRAFMAVTRPESPRPVYVPTEEIAVDPVSREIVLRMAEREWRTLRAKYADLEEFIAMVRRDLGEGAA